MQAYNKICITKVLCSVAGERSVNSSMVGEKGRKVVVVGGAGQAGRIHTANLLELSADVACYDLVPNPGKKMNRK